MTVINAFARSAASPATAAAHAAGDSVVGGVWGVRDGCVAGFAFNPAAPDQPMRLDATIDGRAAVCSTGYDPAVIGLGAGPPRSGFLLPLPAMTTAGSAAIELTERHSGVRLYAGSLDIGASVHPRGHLASDILELQKQPLCKLQYFRFDGDILTLFGFAQSRFGAAAGDRSRITAVDADGQTLETNPYIPTSAGHDYTFWYVPGAQQSGVGITIPAADFKAGAEDITVTLEHAGHAADPIEALANTTWWPCRLRAYGPYPGLSRLQRVHAAEDAKSVAISGYTDARRLRRIFEHYAGDIAGRSILDWGCGHGRVIRHLADDGDLACSGVDIDHDNVAWAKANVPGVAFVTSGLRPPIPFPRESFDLVYGLSVMTHLMPDMQQCWLAELSRVMRKGALCMLTSAGDAAVAYSSRFLDPRWIAQYRADGWNATSYDNFAGTGDADYYRNVHHGAAYVREHWAPHFRIVAIHERVFGYQDIAILEKS